MDYQISIDLHGRWFVTVSLGTCDAENARGIFNNFTQKFPAKEGYSLTLYKQETISKAVAYSEGA